MKIETPRMIIRDFVPEDADELQEILGDDVTMAFCEPAYSPQKTRAFLQSFCIERHGAVAAVHQASGKVIGYILFNDQGDGVYEMGWLFNRGFCRQGYACEACRAAIDYAFGALRAHKVFAETIDPVRSVGLMKKLACRWKAFSAARRRTTTAAGWICTFTGCWKMNGRGMVQYQGTRRDAALFLYRYCNAA